MTIQTLSAPVEPIPPVHQVGDPNHTPDHNSMVQVLIDYDNDIGALQTTIANMFSVAGANVCTITGTSTGLATVNLPSGNRDSAADALDVMCAGVKVFSLNGYGELRIFPALASHVAQIIKAQPSQTADLLELQDSSGNILARFTANGTFIPTQPVIALQPGTSNAETWHPVSLDSGWSNAASNPVCSYRMREDNCVETVAYLNHSSFTGNLTIASGGNAFPALYRPATHQHAAAYTNSGGCGVALLSTGVFQIENAPSGSTNARFTARFPLDI